MSQNMISQLRQRINDKGMTIINREEFNQLQTEWIKRAINKEAAKIAIIALRDIEMSPYGIEGYPSAEETAQYIQARATEALNEIWENEGLDQYLYTKTGK